MAKRKEYLDLLKKKLKFDWSDEGLLEQALTHSSFTYESRQNGLENNQRLEFLGDAVLELVISDYLYRNHPGFDEGSLTKLRASVVCEASLARAARALGLGPCLLMGKGEERSGGRERPSILADAFEALLGAVYLDQGLDKAAELAIQFLSPVLKDVLEGRLERDYKTELQEYVQQRHGEQVQYVILKEEGPDHHKIFTAGVLYKGKLAGSGTGRSKKDAEQQAAKSALLKQSIQKGNL
ncbi:MAG TPA: ribonuclease III [Bacillota bacterium]|nr:ribonuclease III [Peptococcaceae bacterium MAG4]NLW37432.1 ribonuclease III [Peptococcaceae bacterium]HPZ43462.1 ribonuclease III [Bacillota bacterium]HQD76436.1 ribonuclease III [Bacillota bacterium]HUM58635.1 ribonuclease III [Bacillota bacterium]